MPRKRKAAGNVAKAPVKKAPAKSKAPAKKRAKKEPALPIATVEQLTAQPWTDLLVPYMGAATQQFMLWCFTASFVSLLVAQLRIFDVVKCIHVCGEFLSVHLDKNTRPNTCIGMVLTAMAAIRAQHPNMDGVGIYWFRAITRSSWTLQLEKSTAWVQKYIADRVKIEMPDPQKDKCRMFCTQSNKWKLRDIAWRIGQIVDGMKANNLKKFKFPLTSRGLELLRQGIVDLFDRQTGDGDEVMCLCEPWCDRIVYLFGPDGVLSPDRVSDTLSYCCVGQKLKAVNSCCNTRVKQGAVPVRRSRWESWLRTKSAGMFSSTRKRIKVLRKKQNKTPEELARIAAFDGKTRQEHVKVYKTILLHLQATQPCCPRPHENGEQLFMSFGDDGDKMWFSRVWQRASPDRIDNDEDYTPDNVRLVCEAHQAGENHKGNSDRAQEASGDVVKLLRSHRARILEILDELIAAMKAEEQLKAEQGDEEDDSEDESEDEGFESDEDEFEDEEE